MMMTFSDDQLTTVTAAGVVEENETDWTKVGEQLRMVTSIIQLLLGTIGNVLTLAIMLRRPLKHTSAGVYFAAIAIGDTIYLYLGLVDYLLNYFQGLRIQAIHPLSCKTWRLLLFTAGDFSIWLLVVVTIDRFIAVVIHVKAKEWCTTKNALRLCLLTLGLAFTKNLHILWTRGKQTVTASINGTYPSLPTTTEIGGVEGILIIDAFVMEQTTISITANCGFPFSSAKRYEKYIRPWVSFATLAVIPSIVILTLNIWIVYALRMQQKAIRQASLSSANSVLSSLTDSTRSGTNSPQINRKKNGPVTATKDSRGFKQITAMFLGLTLEFLILIPPGYIMLIVEPYAMRNSYSPPQFRLVRDIVLSILFTHHAANFYVYCLTAKGFRREVKQMLCLWTSTSPHNKRRLLPKRIRDKPV